MYSETGKNLHLWFEVTVYVRMCKMLPHVCQCMRDTAARARLPGVVKAEVRKVAALEFPTRVLSTVQANYGFNRQQT